MATESFNREGEPIRPLGYIGDGPDFEVMRRNDGSRHWCGYSRDRLLDSGDDAVAETVRDYLAGLLAAGWFPRRFKRCERTERTDHDCQGTA
jgi:hypothetical protein